MSQAGITQSGSGGAGPLSTLTGDNGIAVPPDGASNINLLTGVGLTSTGVVLTNTITFTQDGANEGTGTTVGAVTADVITIPLGAVAGTYTIEARVAGFEATTPAGAGYQLVAMFRTTGAAATQIGITDRIANEEAALTACNADFIASANNIILRVTGTIGLTIDWKAFSLYTLVT